MQQQPLILNEAAISKSFQSVTLRSNRNVMEFCKTQASEVLCYIYEFYATVCSTLTLIMSVKVYRKLVDEFTV
jgi:hypothetical protein